MSKSWIFLLILVFLGILSSVAMFVFNKNEKTSSVAINPGSFEAHVKKDGNSIAGQIRNMGSTISFRVPIAEATMSTAGYTTAFDTSHSAFAYEIKNNDKDKELKETITLKNANAPRMFSYRFIMENISSFNYDPAKKSWHFFNSNNKEVFYIPAGFMIDANGVRSNNVKIGIEKLEGKYVFLYR